MNVPILTCIQLLTSASIIYHYDYSTDCHFSLRVVQNFYTSQSLGGPETPPDPLNDARDMHKVRLSVRLSLKNTD